MKLDNVSVTCLIPGAADTSLYDSGKINTPLLKKLGLMKNPEAVAKAGVRALFGDRAVCIPGVINKITVFLLPLIPRYIIEVLARRTGIIRKRK
jgi:short-subunit dehydrogenase